MHRLRRYGLQRIEGQILFPLGISAIELAAQGHVDVFVSYVYTDRRAATPAGRVQLTPSEAEDLAGELLSIVESVRSRQT